MAQEENASRQASAEFGLEIREASRGNEVLEQPSRRSTRSNMHD